MEEGFDMVTEPMPKMREKLQQRMLREMIQFSEPFKRGDECGTVQQ